MQVIGSSTNITADLLPVLRFVEVRCEQADLLARAGCFEHRRDSELITQLKQSHH